MRENSEEDERRRQHTRYQCDCSFFFFKQKTAYEIYQCDWSSDVCSSDLAKRRHLTSRQAGLLAGEAQVKQLRTFHFSPKHKGRESQLREEAEDAFQEIKNARKNP